MMTRISRHGEIVEQVEAITTELTAVKKKAALLEDMAAITPEQRAAVASLLRGIDFVRGCELGQLRQSVGLDQELVRFNRGLKR